MSKLEELIQQYCPEGVEWKMIGDVCKVKTPPCKLKTSEYKNIGKYPIIDQGQQPIAGYTDNEKAVLEDYEYILYGDHTCIVKYHNGHFAQGADGLKILISKNDNSKYIYYALSAYNLTNTEYKRHWTQAKEIEIPIPPLPVQEEIVRILDTFTELQTELQAELQAELQKRKQQYNYYRDNLLSNFTPGQYAKEYTLEEVTKDIFSGATPSKERKDFWDGGTIPWMSSGEVNLGQVYAVEGRITQLGYDKCSTKMVPEGSVVIALAGQGKTRGTVALLRTSVCTNQSLAALVPNNEIVSGEYLFHFLKTQYSKLREVSAGDGTRGGLNLKMLRSYRVIIPSKEVQTQIVRILNRFDALTNDLTVGLPAEIEKRRQQYEYYRDKLLTFKRKEA